MKRTLSTCLAIALIVIAIPQNNVSAAHTTPVELTMEAPTFDITLPTALPVTVGAAGDIVVATGVKVINNSTGPVKVTDITVQGLNGYTITSYSDEIVGTDKRISMKINNMDTKAGGGSLGLTSPFALSPKAELPVVYEAKTSFHDTASVLNPASVTFTAGFAVWSPPPPPPPPSVGTKVTIGDYEYSYGESFSGSYWSPTSGAPDGYGVRLLNKTKTKYDSPETTIGGIPVTNMSNLFRSVKVSSLDLSSFDTSNVKEMNNMFAYSEATTIDVSSFNTSKVLGMGGMFTSSKASTLDLSNFDTSRVSDMRSMFQDTMSLESINLSSFTTNSLLHAGRMFSFCGAKDIDLSKAYMLNVSSLESMFESSSASTIKLPVRDTRYTHSAISMKAMFKNCSATDIDFSNFGTKGATDMSEMFFGSVAVIKGINMFDTSRVETMADMFSSYQGAHGPYDVDRVLDLSSFDVTYVNDMTGMFKNSEIDILDLSSFDVTNLVSSDNMFKYTVTKTAYARTQADIDILKATYNFPADLTFMVKTP